MDSKSWRAPFNALSSRADVDASTYTLYCTVQCNAMYRQGKGSIISIMGVLYYGTLHGHTMYH